MNPLELGPFEEFMYLRYPRLQSEWELSGAVDYIDLDEWVDQNHPEVMREWKEKRKKKKLRDSLIGRTILSESIGDGS